VRRLEEIREKSEKLIVGLSSGTSADGVDAALVRLSGSGLNTKASVILHDTYPYPLKTRQAVLLAAEGKGEISSVCQLNYELGEVFSDACAALLEGSGFAPEGVDAVGLNGQTVCHLPPRGRGNRPGCTLQLAEPSVISQRTGALVVYDFRSADVAAGGQGAPLAPCVDYLLFRDERASRGLLNIGGIANLTVLPANCQWQDVMGFDTGPGNMVLDYLARKLFRLPCDTDGEYSSRGKASEEVFEGLLADEFFRTPPPKSTGRELFGESFSKELLRRARSLGLGREDVLATASMLTASSVHRAYLDFARGDSAIDELYVSGGGAANRTLMTNLEELFSPTPVLTTEELGVDIRAKEALLFAVLANQAISGEPSSLPQVTGADRRVVLGKIVP
jgi:anhydro-N-acetylmuramic acid kinase